MNKSKAIRQRQLKLAFPIFFLSYYFSEVVSGWPLLRHMGLRGGRNFEDFYAILESARCKPGSFYPGTNQLCIFPYGSSLRWFLKIIPIPLAHRLSTIRNADQVVYMDKGTVLAVGTFEQVRALIPNFEKQSKLMGL